MEDMKVQISEDVLSKAAVLLNMMKVRYQSKSGQTSSRELGNLYLAKANAVDEVITAIYQALEDAEEAEYQAMLEQENRRVEYGSDSDQ